ncbi:MAG: tryptophan--tRNA ligase, partial [Gemmatimonadetes bacterium]|nr:tryptophan--tRNA ligase [Gemmatimonadota bacterium]
SDVPETSELQWILGTVTPMALLQRGHAYKDALAKDKNVDFGLFAYPVLMAADILLYRAEKVPVGDDQVQHLELTRELARRWNAAFAGEAPVFPEPQPILSPARRIVGLDGQAKMSKSLGNTIGVMESPEAIWQKLRPAVTDPARVTKSDPGTPEICNLYALHRHFSPPETVEEVATNCRTAGWGCIDCKKVLAANMTATLAPLRERGLELASRPGEVADILASGADAARRQARETMATVTERMGFLPEGR